MSRLGSVTFEWGGEDRTFRLGLKELEALEEMRAVSPYALLERLQRRQPMMRDCRLVLLHGLTGAGVPMDQATRIVRVYCDEAVPADSLVPATAVLAAGLYGVPEDPPGKPEGEGKNPTPPQTGE